MSTLAATPENTVPKTTQSSYARIPAAFRLQFVVKSTFISAPLMVFGAAWAIAMAIALWIHSTTDRSAVDTLTADDAIIITGSPQAVLGMLMFTAAYSASHTFPFSMALSYSRRVFVMGAFLAFAAVSAAFGTAFALAAGIERATDGYGIHVYNFDLPFFTQGTGGIPAAGLVTAVLCLFLMMIGFFWSILYRRVALMMLWIIIIGVIAVLLAGIMVTTQNDWWPSIWQWFTNQNALTLSGWLVLPLVAVAVINYLVIRKATPTP